MRRLLFLFALCAALTTGGIAYADDGGGMTVASETVTIDVGAPKGVEGADGIRCTGRASAGGYTLVYTNYVGADAGEMASNPDRERAWQTAHCHYLLENHMAGWFLYQHDIHLDTEQIKVTIDRL